MAGKRRASAARGVAKRAVELGGMEPAILLHHEAAMEIGGADLLVLLRARQHADRHAGATMERLGVAAQRLEMRGREGAEEAATELEVRV